MKKITFALTYVSITIFVAPALAALVLLGNPGSGYFIKFLLFSLYIVAAWIAYVRGKSIEKSWMIGFPIAALVAVFIPIIAKSFVDMSGYAGPGEAIRNADPVIRMLIGTAKYPVPFVVNIACCIVGVSSDRQEQA